MSRVGKWLLGTGAALSLLILAAAALFVLRPMLAEALPVRSIMLQGASMEPNYPEGSRMLMKAYKGRPEEELLRGQVVLFAGPDNPARSLVKRIIAIGGDTVEIREGALYINGILLEEPYPVISGPDSMDKRVVQPDHVWVLGDNRPRSFDSRHFGDLPRSAVQAVLTTP